MTHTKGPLSRDDQLQQQREEAVLRKTMIVFREKIKKLLTPGHYGSASVTLYAQNGKLSSIECNDKQTHLPPAD